MGREELTHMADQADWSGAYWHVDGTASGIGAMFAVVHGGESVLAEPRAS